MCPLTQERTCPCSLHGVCFKTHWAQWLFMPLRQELPGERELNLNLGMEPAVRIRWRRPRAAVLGKRWAGWGGRAGGSPPWASCLHSERLQGLMPTTDAGFQLSCCSAAGSLALRCLSVVFCSARLPVLPTSRVCRSKEAVEENSVVQRA